MIRYLPFFSFVCFVVFDTLGGGGVLASFTGDRKLLVFDMDRRRCLLPTANVCMSDCEAAYSGDMMFIV